MKIQRMLINKNNFLPIKENHINNSLTGLEKFL